MFRSILMTLPPVLFPDDSYLQYLWMLSTLVGSVCIHLAVKPYLDRYANWLETAELSFLTLILCLGSYFMNDVEHKDNEGRENALMVLLIGLVVACFLMIFLVFCYALYLALFPDKAEKAFEKEIDSWKHSARSALDAIAGLDDDSFVKFLKSGTYLEHKELIKLAGWTSVELASIQPVGFFNRRLPKQRIGTNSFLTQAVDVKSQNEALVRITKSSSRISLEDIDNAKIGETNTSLASAAEKSQDMEGSKTSEHLTESEHVENEEVGV